MSREVPPSERAFRKAIESYRVQYLNTQKDITIPEEGRLSHFVRWLRLNSEPFINDLDNNLAEFTPPKDPS